MKLMSDQHQGAGANGRATAGAIHATGAARTNVQTPHVALANPQPETDTYTMRDETPTPSSDALTVRPAPRISEVSTVSRMASAHRAGVNTYAQQIQEVDASMLPMHVDSDKYERRRAADLGRGDILPTLDSDKEIRERQVERVERMRLADEPVVILHCDRGYTVTVQAARRTFYRREG